MDFLVHHQLPEHIKLMSIESLMSSNHLILCRPLLLLPSIFPSIRVFSNESALHLRWWKYWSFSFSISPSSEYLGLISFRIDWFVLLTVQRTLKGLLQHHSSKASVFRRSAFIMGQLSHPYTTTGKTMALSAKWYFNKQSWFQLWFIQPGISHDTRCSVQFSCSVVSNSLQPHGLQHTSPPCPSPTPRVCSNSCPLSRWCDQTISSSVVSSPSPLTFNLSQHQGLSNESALHIRWPKVLEFQLQHQSFQWTPRTGLL